MTVIPINFYIDIKKLLATIAKQEEKLQEKSLLKKLSGMRRRCYNPNSISYKYYGAKGIEICEEWLNNSNKFIFWSIENGYSQINNTLHRINSDKGYTPTNCLYTTQKLHQKYHAASNHINIYTRQPIILQKYTPEITSPDDKKCKYPNSKTF